ncbi:hypothetical protein OSTOST_14557, partial [Ostertagia ostertagi]
HTITDAAYTQKTSKTLHPAQWARAVQHNNFADEVPVCSSSQLILLNFVDASILSKLELPTLDGKILEYPDFSYLVSRFATLVGNKVQLDDTTKFAVEIVSAKSRSSCSARTFYDSQQIQGRYGHPGHSLRRQSNYETYSLHQVVTTAGLRFRFPNLQALYDQNFASVRQFAEDGNDPNETRLGAILLSKLPARFARKPHYQKWTITHVRAIILRVTSFMSNPKRILSTFQTQCRKGKNAPCHCQNSNHTSIACDTFPTPRDRNRRVEQLHLCYSCLSSQHGLEACTSKQYSKFCGRRHHSSLCLKHSNVRIKKGSLHKLATPSPLVNPRCELRCFTERNQTHPRQPRPIWSQLLADPPIRTKTFIKGNICHGIFTGTGPTQSYITYITGELTQRGKHLRVKSLPTLTEHLRHAHPSDTKNGKVAISSCKPFILIGNDYFWNTVLSNDFYYETLPNGYSMLHTSVGNIPFARL